VKEKTIITPVGEKVILFPYLNQVSMDKLREIIMEKIFFFFTLAGSITIFGVLFFILSNAGPVIKASGLSFFLTGGWEEQFFNTWLATAPSSTHYRFGALELIGGTVLTTGGALILAFFFGLGGAIFLTELCPLWLRRPLASVVRLLSAIPPVIYGLVGLLVIVPFIFNYLISEELALKMIETAALDGTCLLAGIIVLGLMITPYFTILSTEAWPAGPRSYQEAALSLGVSPWRTMTGIIVPAARPGILAGLILATGTAVGEFVALAMVSGSVTHLPSPVHGLVFFLEPVQTLASAIFVNAEALGVAPCESALFALATLILALSIIFSLLARLINRQKRKEAGEIE
jgi:phosphate ABC transporter permease protein PstC